MEGDDTQANQYYNNSRSHFTYYESLYKDHGVMEKLRSVLSFNPMQIRGKVILELGAGPGLLSLLAARSGAKKVYAWEPTSLSMYAKQTIKDNNFEEIIEVVTDPLEELQLPAKVDVIFCAIFGNCAYFESLIPQIIYARDHFLAEGGILLPSKVRLSLSTFEVPSGPNQRKSFWDKVYGYDYTPIKIAEVEEPIISDTPAARIHTEPCTLWKLNLYKVTREDLDIHASFILESDAQQNLKGFVIWFDLIFQLHQKVIEITTSPFEEETHWDQLVLPFPLDYPVTKGVLITGDMDIKIADGNRCRRIAFDVTCTIGSRNHKQHFILK